MKVTRNYLSLLLLTTSTLVLGDSVAQQLAPFLKSNTPVARSGDAEGIGGGDTVDGYLQMAINDVDQSLHWIQEGKWRGELCQKRECPVGVSTTLCALNNAQSQTEANYCNQFAKELAKQIISRKTQVAFDVQSSTTKVRNLAGYSRDVRASTPLGPKGSVTVKRETLVSLSREELVGLIVHELGHKIYYPNTQSTSESSNTISDNRPIGPFETGRALLDTVGAAIALYSFEHRRPLQSPPDIAQPLREPFCNTLANQPPFVMGLGADVLGKIADPKEQKQWNLNPSEAKSTQLPPHRFKLANRVLASDVVQLHVLTELFQHVLRRDPNSAESMLLKTSLNTGAPYDAVLAALISDPEYRRRNKIKDDEQFAIHLYQDLFGREPSAAEIRDTILEMKNKSTPALVIQLLNRSQGVVSHLIAKWFRKYLNRVPSQKEHQGYFSKIQEGATWNSIQASILSTPEYLSLQQKRVATCRGETGQKSFEAKLRLK